MVILVGGKAMNPRLLRNGSSIFVLALVLSASSALQAGKSQLENLIIERSKDINRQCPIMVDSATRLDVTIAAGDVLIYKYTLINTAVADMDTSYFHSEVERRTTESYCSMDNMRQMLNDGVKCRYLYFDINGTHVTSFLITSQTCVDHDLLMKSNWARTTIAGVGTIDVPPSLEVQEGQLREMSGSSYGLVLQQKGLNAQTQSSLGTYVRVMVETFPADSPGDFRRAGSKIEYSAAELEEISTSLRMQAEMPGITILQWDKPKVVEVNGVTAICVEYSRAYKSNTPARVALYMFEDYDRIHKLTLSYRVSESEMWAAALQGVLQSFRISH
jgi:hypothetical protein